ncbi:galactose mutarotase [Sulfitobacter sp. 1151]|uniref:Galactose mutarotase n=2 Tax=Parasulfitobacter algicola TaxID=2614809 RepID=A0ABX2ISS2_9RHOB|nr:galactose mutarotase [Sulfitobacter algicola]
MTMCDWGTLPDGRTAKLITLSNDRLRVNVLSFGAAIQSVHLDDIPHSLTSGFDHLAPYLRGKGANGCIVGPVANRIGGAQAMIDGQLHHFDANEAGRTTRHSGSAGTHLQLWHPTMVAKTYAELQLPLPDGQGGFPGNRTLIAAFILSEATLSLRLSATTDRTTLINLANHSYWNLGGAPTYAGHRLQINADHYLPTHDNLPTGEIAPVAGTHFDFRTPRDLTPGTDAVLDHNFCLSNTRRPVTDVATLTGPSGLSMTMATTEPGLQIYDGANFPGAPYAGLAIEAQSWPDAPNHSIFPSINLSPDHIYSQTTCWTFGQS